MAWNAWGDPPPPNHSRTGSATCCSRPSASRPPTRRHPASTTSSWRPALAEPHRDALASIVGPAICAPTTWTGSCTPAASRRWICCGASRSGRIRRTQLLPATEDEIARILAYCSEHAIAVVPFGGGTSVVGGLDPIRGRFGAVVTLDLRRLDALHWLDEVSGEAELGAVSPGRTPNDCSANGASRWGTSRRASGSPPSAASPPPARRAELRRLRAVQRHDPRLHVVTPAGVLDLGRAPNPPPGRTCANSSPAPRACSGSSPGAVAVHPKPQAVRYEAWSFPDFATGADALRAVTQTGTARPCCSGCPTRPRPGSTWRPPRASANSRSPAAAWPSRCSRAAPNTPSRHAETRRCWRPTAARRWVRARRRPGSTAGSMRRTCATRCWPAVRCAKPWRRQPPGRTSQR